MWIRWSPCNAALSGSCWLLWVCLCLADREDVCSKDDDSCSDALPPCPYPPPDLGHFEVDDEMHTMEEIIAKAGPDVKEGGSWKPPHCKAHQRVAVIVPYRDRENHLKVFLSNLHPFLQKQLLDYTIFLSEQSSDSKHFNRGSMFNAAFTEISHFSEKFDCIVLHDVDNYPENTQNLFTCDHRMKHLCAKQAMLHPGAEYRESYYPKFIGVAVAMAPSIYEKVNGFSNMFWGWGSEDDDFYNRIQHHGVEWYRADTEIGGYRDLWHHRLFVNPQRRPMLRGGPSRFDWDGLNSKFYYKLLDTEKHPLYTKLRVELLHPDYNVQ